MGSGASYLVALQPAEVMHQQLSVNEEKAAEVASPALLVRGAGLPRAGDRPGR